MAFNTPTLLKASWGRNMQEAKRYKAWHVTHTVPYEVLNVANKARGRQACGDSRVDRRDHKPRDSLMDHLGYFSHGKMGNAAEDV